MKESIQEQKLQQKILEGTIEAFNQKGLKFTMWTLQESSA